MDQEKNIKSIRALEEQIREGKGDTIQLKRLRNSLLNISVRVPPEILGKIFAWTIVRERHYLGRDEELFSGFGKDPHNFLLVCHHWFEVAISTPELWKFWGVTLEDWKKRYHRAEAVPIDLVLEHWYIWRTYSKDICPPLRDALRDRADRDMIRQIHLHHPDVNFLALILSLLTPSDEGTPKKCITSIAVVSENLPDLSGFFARSRLPKLELLYLCGTLPTPIWDLLIPQTTQLTVLSLLPTGTSLPPTRSQLLSILASNPGLQELHLFYAAVPEEEDGTETRVPLPQLRSIYVVGKFRRIFVLLSWLEIPAALDHKMILLQDSATLDVVLKIIGPHLRDHFQRDIKFPDRLGVWIYFRKHNSSHDGDSVDIIVSRFEPDLEWQQTWPYARFSVRVHPPLLDSAIQELPHDLMAFIPRGHEVSLKVSPSNRPQNIADDQF